MTKSAKDVPLFSQFSTREDAMWFLMSRVPGGRAAYVPVLLDNGMWTLEYDPLPVPSSPEEETA